MEALLPENEEARLAALKLYRVLDTLPEQTYEDLTLLAASICDSPMALITFIDQKRQWFKAKVGVDGGETPRAEAFCAHTILQPQEMLIVPDAQRDPRFTDNPAVQGEMHVRFYAGAPLVTSDGYALGTICVIDTAARQLTAQQKHSLQILARQVMVHLELRRALVEREQTEQAKHFLASIVESSEDSILTINFDRVITSWNKAAETLYGYRAEEVLGQNLTLLTLPQDLQQVLHNVERIKHSQAVEVFDTIRVNKNGREMQLEVALSPVKDKTGEVIGVSTIARDITQRKRVEESLRESEARFSGAFEHAPIGVALVSLEGRWLQVNQALCEVLGYSEAELLARTFQQITHPDDLEADLENVHRLLAGEIRSYQMEKRYFHARGDLVTVLLSVSLVRGEEGQPLYFISQIHDVTDRKLAEGALRESEAEFRTLAEAMPQMVWITRPDGLTTYFSQQWMDYTGLTLEESLGHGWNTPFHPDDRGRAWHAWQHATATVGTYSVESRLRRADGVYRWYLVRGVPLQDADGHIIKWFGTCTDIHDLKLAEEELRESEARFQTFMDNSPAIAFIMDEQSRFVYVNQPFENEMGMKLSAESRLSVFDVWPEEIARVMHEQNMAVLDGSRLIPVTMTIPNEGGEVQEWAIWKFLLLDATGRRLVAGLSLDVTEERRTALALRASDERFRSIVANVPGTVYQFVLHEDGSLEMPFVSDGCREMFEVEAQSIKQNPNLPLNMIHPDDRDEFNRSMMAAKEALEPWNWQGRLRMPSGVIKWIQGASHPQRLPEGGTLCTGLFMDFTARKEAEEERDRFFTLSLDMLAIVGTDGYFKRINPAWEATLGFSRAEMMAAPYLERVHPDDHAATLFEHERLRVGKEVMQFENRYRCRDGSYKWLRWMSVSCEDLFYCVAHDITAMREAEAALQAANDELEARVMRRTAELGTANELLRIENLEHEMTMETLRQVAAALQLAKEEAERATQEANIANDAKSEFLSRMSHELRTPLNSILGFGQILENQDLTPRQHESIGYILKGGRHLLGLINEVLDIARVEAGHLELSIEAVALTEVVAECCALVRPLAQERGIQIKNNSAQTADYHAMADRQRLKQVLLNLLSNAIKYNREGGQVTIFVVQAAAQLQLRVHDTGPGISAPDLKKLFTPFERLNAADSQIEGTGLGLVLSQRIVTAMGGTLAVESRLGEGTNFWIELPRAESPLNALKESVSIAATQAIPEAEKTYTVLSIEDNLSNVRLLEAILEDRPAITLLAAMQGSLGLDLARQHHPDVILLDLNLPGIPGGEVLEQLRASNDTKNIPVVVISADATPIQIERLLAAGAFAYLTKPIDVTEFLNTLDDILQTKDE